MTRREKIIFFLSFSFLLILFFISHIAVVELRGRISDLEDRAQILESQMDETVTDERDQAELKMLILAELEDIHARLVNHTCQHKS